MAKKSAIKLRPGANIGAPAAEDDHAYLRDCFVDLPLVDALKDIGSPHSILLGRTGSGKSAMIWHLSETLANTSRVDPKSHFGSTPKRYLRK